LPECRSSASCPASVSSCAKQLARRVYLVFAVIGLVLTVVSSSSYSGSFASYIVGVGLDVATVALLIHPSVRHAFD
jgi:hypothetical protein